MLVYDLKRKIARHRREVARGPLRHLLEHAAYRALEPLAGADFTPANAARMYAAVQDGFERLADAGALVYFGIRDRAELGDLPVQLVGVDEFGSVRADVWSAVEEVMRGGRRREGWSAPGRLTVEDLER